MYKHLVREQRYAIGLMLKEKKSKKEIAAAIGCSESTVYREIKRNSGKRGYSYSIAQEQRLSQGATSWQSRHKRGSVEKSPYASCR